MMKVLLLLFLSLFWSSAKAAQVCFESLGPLGPGDPFTGVYPNTPSFFTDPPLTHSPIPGRDNTPGILVGGDFVVLQGAEAEGVVVVQGNLDLQVTNGYSMVQVGYGSGILPEDGSVALLVGGDAILQGTVWGMNIGDTTGVDFAIAGSLSGPGMFDIQGNVLIGADIASELLAYQALLDDLVIQSNYWATSLPVTAELQWWNRAGSTDSRVDAEWGNMIVVDTPDNGPLPTPPEGACGTLVVVDVDPSFLANLEASSYAKLFKFSSNLAGATILMNVPTTDGSGNTVLANIAQFIDSNNQADLAFDSAQKASILWNFYEATGTVTLNMPAQFVGSVLVPSADLLMQAPGQGGRTIVGGNLIQDRPGSEFHNYEFDPPCPLPPTDEDCEDEEDCPEGDPNLKLLYVTVNGMLWDTDSSEYPITIVAQTASSVIFSFQQAWETTLSEIFVYYNTGIAAPGEQVCLAYQDAVPGDVLEESIELSCTHTTPHAIVDIFVQDPSITVFDNLPECCHAEDEDLPTIRYTIELYCTPQPCPSDEETSARNRFLTSSWLPQWIVGSA